MYETRFINGNVFVKFSFAPDSDEWYLVYGPLFDMAMNAHVIDSRRPFQVAVWNINHDVTLRGQWMEPNMPIENELITLHHTTRLIEVFGFRGVEPHELLRGREEWHRTQQ